MASSDQKMTRMAADRDGRRRHGRRGIFSLPRTFANATGPLGAVIAWIIAGTGMYMLARVFQALAERKPDLDAGVYRLRQGRLRRLSRASCRRSATGSAAASATSRTGC